MSDARIYLDNAATTAVDPAVIEVMTACLGPSGYFGNPSSSHATGAAARRVVERARAQIAERIGAASREVIFTSGATESDNMALVGAVRAAAGGDKHLITSRIEHHAVLDTARALEADGVAVTLLPCDSSGRIDAHAVAEAIRDETVLVSIMHVNNEIGAVQDIDAIGRVCRARGVLFHVDAAQSAGKLPIDLASLPVDLMSLTAHKAHGPKGIGALYVREGVKLTPLLHGGEQERGLRAGTLATHQIAGFGKTFELADPDSDGPRLDGLKMRLWQRLEALGGVRLNGSLEHCAPHILNVCFAGVEGESLRLGLADIAVSAGSACASEDPEPSHVLSGIGLSDALAQSSLRFSVGRFTEAAEIERAAGRIADEVRRLRDLAGSAPVWSSS